MTRKIAFYLSMLIAQTGAFILFKDLADISQWVVQSSREFTMFVWYNKEIFATVSISGLIVSLVIWRSDSTIISKRRGCPSFK